MLPVNAHFISEGEARKVLALMEHALACKQKASEMGNNDVKDSVPATPASATATAAKKEESVDQGAQIGSSRLCTVTRTNCRILVAQ